MTPSRASRAIKCALAFLALTVIETVNALQPNSDQKQAIVLFQKSGAFNHGLTIKPGDQLIFEFPVQAKTCHFGIKPIIDAALDIQIYQDGELVAKGTGGIQTYHQVIWLPGKAGSVQARIKSTDNLANQCVVNFHNHNEGPPPPVNLFSRPIPFTEVVVTKPNDQLTFHLPVKPGKATFTIQAEKLARLEVQITQNGIPVARDLIRSNKLALSWNVAAAGTAIVQVKCADSFGNGLTVGATAEHAAKVKKVPPTPPASEPIKKNGPFSDKVTLRPKDNLTYQVPVEAGQCRLTIRSVCGTALVVKVRQKGVVVAEDDGLKREFSLDWNAAVAGSIEVQIYSTDILTTDCKLDFSQKLPKLNQP